MFYVKTEIKEGVTLCTEITDENTFTRCVDCGCEIQVDLDDVVVDGHIDLFGTGMRCVDCRLQGKTGDLAPCQHSKNLFRVKVGDLTLEESRQQ